MATAYFMLNELNNLQNKIFRCLNQLKCLKKISNIDKIYKDLIKINGFWEISKHLSCSNTGNFVAILAT